ncbi:MAG TPA: DUF4249 domain-containing protein [Bacteroidota bacterium]|nr:DUF4249 domain-containing protein [Bacteroidota bacterium]
MKTTSSFPWALLLFVLPLLTAFIACQKIVSIDLNEAAPHIVIEGNITDQHDTTTVLISKTGTYFSSVINVPPVSHAIVTITDDLGKRDTLYETLNGTYESTTLKGLEGRRYSLKVVSEGNVYTAESSMPQKVTIDSLYTIPVRERDGDVGYDIYVMFKDPPERGNYYRIRPRVNSLPPDSINGARTFLYSDKLANGEEITERIGVRIRNGSQRAVVHVGDTITVDLLSIDQPTYEYYKTLATIRSSDQSATALSPANPNTNLSNGSLGYFSAYTYDSKQIILR